jgi:uncharacterized protein
VRIWLDQVREEPFTWDETQSISPETLERPELLSLSPVSWRGQVVFADPGYYLRARLSYDQTLACGRCLKPIVEHVEPEIELMIVQAGGSHDAHHGAEQELGESELSVQVVEGEVLETDPILLEQLQLNIPMSALCQPDCRGLCPVCGADRNVADCSCEERTVDSRWSALAALKSRLDQKNG